MSKMLRPYQAWYIAVHCYDCLLQNFKVVKWVIGPGRLVEGGIVVVRVHQFNISRQDNKLTIPFLGVHM